MNKEPSSSVNQVTPNATPKAGPKLFPIQIDTRLDRYSITVRIRNRLLSLSGKLFSGLKPNVAIALAQDGRPLNLAVLMLAGH